MTVTCVGMLSSPLTQINALMTSALVICCWEANNYKQQLRTLHVYCLTVSVGWDWVLVQQTLCFIVPHKATVRLLSRMQAPVKNQPNIDQLFIYLHGICRITLPLCWSSGCSTWARWHDTCFTKGKPSMYMRCGT